MKLVQNSNQGEVKALSYEQFQKVARDEKLPIAVRWDALYRVEDGYKEYFWGHQTLSAKSPSEGEVTTYVQYHGNSKEFPLTSKHEFTPENLEQVLKGVHKGTSYYLQIEGTGRRGVTKAQWFSAERGELLTAIKKIQVDIASLAEAVHGAIAKGPAQKP